MKKIMLSLGVVAAAALSLVSCQKENFQPNEPAVTGTPFSLTASIADTKTANDGLKTVWVADDAINLFHAEAGKSTYSNDGQFTLADADTGKFDGTLAGELTAASYDWYAFYQYSSFITDPINDNKGYSYIFNSSDTPLVQKGYNSKAHLSDKACPLYAIAKNISTSEPVNLSMKNIASVVKIVVTNNNEEPLTINNVSFTSTESIVGTFYVNFSAEPIVLTDGQYVANTASLNVTNGTPLAKGETAEFYLPIKPHTAANHSTLKISVNGYEKTLELPKDVEFVAGNIKPLNFNYDKEAPQIEFYTKINSLAEFNPNAKTIIVGTKADGTTYIHGNYNTSSYLEANPVTIVGGQVNYDGTPVIFEPVNGNYYIKYGNDYLSYTANSKNTVTIGSVKDEWKLSFESDLFKITNVTDNTRVLQFNQSSPRFACYAGTQANVSLYQVVGPDTRVALDTPQNVLGMLNEDDENVTNSIDVVWDIVANAVSYEVTATPSNGTARSIIIEGSESKATTITDLAYETEYTISVVAKAPAGSKEYKDSEAGFAEDKVITGAKPAGSAISEEISGTFSGSTSSISLTTASGITITQNKANGNNVGTSYNTPSSLRIYWKNTLTIASSSHKIVKIEIAYKSGKGGSTLSVNNGTLTTNTQSLLHTWEGSSNSVTITNGTANTTNVQLQTSSITVYYE